MLTDTHTHLTMPDFQDIEGVLDRAHLEGLEFIIDVGFDIVSSEKSTQLSKNSDYIYSAVGVHPHDSKSFNEEQYVKLCELLKMPRVVALGEIGLDYHYDHSTRAEQKSVFTRLLRTAKEYKKPVILHGRESYEDMKTIILDVGGDVPGVFHSFAGDNEILKWALDKGFYISISGMVTFKKAANIQEIVRNTPIDRILIETDAPYLTPEPFRGKRNEPSYVKYVAAKIAEVKGMAVDEVGRITTKNARTLFNIK